MLEPLINRVRQGKAKNHEILPQKMVKNHVEHIKMPRFLPPTFLQDEGTSFPEINFLEHFTKFSFLGEKFKTIIPIEIH